MTVDDKLLTTLDWLSEFNAPFVKLSGFVPLIENCSVLLESTIRINFETPSAIVPSRCVGRLAAEVMLLIRLPSLSSKMGLYLIKSKKVWNWRMRMMD
jgi:hypothetical protein